MLLLTIAGFLVFNSITAFSSNYWLTLAARFFAGVWAGLAWSLLAGDARRMVHVHRQGKALAVAMVGTPIALSLGVPLGTWLGTVVGWRSAFAVMSALTLALIGWVLASVPDYPGQASHEHLPLRRVFTTPGVRLCRSMFADCQGPKHMRCAIVRPVTGLKLVGQQSAPAVATEGCANQRDHDFVIVSRQRGELTFGAAEGPTIESRFD